MNDDAPLAVAWLSLHDIGHLPFSHVPDKENFEVAARQQKCSDLLIQLAELRPRWICRLRASASFKGTAVVLINGEPVVGKTHRRFSAERRSWPAIRYSSSSFTMATLAKAHGPQRLDEKLLALAEKPKLRMSMSSTTCRYFYFAAHLFFQLFSRREPASS